MPLHSWSQSHRKICATLATECAGAFLSVHTTWLDVPPVYFGTPPRLDIEFSLCCFCLGDFVQQHTRLSQRMLSIDFRLLLSMTGTGATTGDMTLYAQQLSPLRVQPTEEVR